jgi:hypothetical protein
MQSNADIPKKRRMTVTPLTSAERAEFIDSVEDPQAQMEAGNFKEYAPEAFKDWRLSDYGAGK